MPNAKKTTAVKEAAPRKRKAAKSQKTSAEKKLTYEEKKELKLQAQRVKDATRKDPPNKDRFYCTNKELLAELVKWRDSNKEEESKLKKGEPIDYTKRKISEELGRMMIMIANKVLNRSEFRNYPKELKEDMAGFAYYKIIRGLKKFDFRFTNCFSFFTTAFYNSYLTILKKHYKHINFRKDLTVKLYSEMETYPGINSASSLMKVIKQYLGEDEGDGYGED